MKILFLTNNSSIVDGWSAVGVNLVLNLANKNNLQVFTGERKNKILFSTKSLKSELFEKYKYLTVIYDIINVILKLKFIPNIIHCNVEYYAPLAFFLSLILQIPYTITIHGSYAIILPKKYFIYRISFKHSSKLIAVSNYTKKRVVNQFHFKNIYVINNGVDKTKFYPRKLKKENIILFVGNLKKRKGFDFLIKTLIETGLKFDDYKLYVIGNINENSIEYFNFRQIIKKNKLNVTFLGKVDEEQLIKYYNISKLNVLPSYNDGDYFEGFGLTHLEANACGTYTIGTLNTGNEDAIHSENGFLVEYGDTKTFSKIILEILNSTEYPKIDYEKFFSWDQISEKYFILFKSLVEKQ